MYYFWNNIFMLYFNFLSFTKKDTGPSLVQFYPRAFAAVEKRNT